LLELRCFLSYVEQIYIKLL